MICSKSYGGCHVQSSASIHGACMGTMDGVHELPSGGVRTPTNQQLDVQMSLPPMGL